jgi:hypothetical protein
MLLMTVVGEKKLEQASPVKRFLVEMMEGQQQRVQVEYHFH